jgi:hypothetical protein
MCLKANTNILDSLRCKKRLEIFPSPAGMKLINKADEHAFTNNNLRACS